MYSWKKDIASWKVGKALYLSVVFTWHLPKARELAIAHKGQVYAGGPAVDLMPDYLADVADVEGISPYGDLLRFHNPLATFTTRGCPNTCSFCAVPRTEGKFMELREWKPAPLICDNNLLFARHRHFAEVIDYSRDFPLVDFNQGLQAELFTPFHAYEIAKLKEAKVRFSFDHSSRETAIMDAIKTARDAGLKNLGVYILLNHEDTPEDAIYRLELIRSMGILPNPMRFHPLTSLKRNEYISPNWTEFMLQKVMQYYSRLIPMKICNIPFDEFEPKTVYKQESLL